MSATKQFKKTIEDYLKQHAFRYPLFAKTLQKPNKNIDDCITYIFNTVKNSGKQGFTDQEIYGMAIHYYDEDDIKPGSKVNIGQVVVNHTPVLSEKEIQEIKEQAKQKVLKEEMDRIRGKNKAKKSETKEEPKPETGTLF